MAKYKRFDTRNKKQNRNKFRSLSKDLKIHEETKKHRINFKELYYKLQSEKTNDREND